MEPEEASERVSDLLSSPSCSKEPPELDDPIGATSLDLTSIDDAGPLSKDKSQIFVHGSETSSGSESTVAKRRKRNRRCHKKKAAARSRSEFAQVEGLSGEGPESPDDDKRQRPDSDPSQEDEASIEETKEKSLEEGNPECQEEVASEGDARHQAEKEEAQEKSDVDPLAGDVREESLYPRDINNNYIQEDTTGNADEDAPDTSEPDPSSAVTAPNGNSRAHDSLDDWKEQNSDVVHEARSIVDQIIAVVTTKVQDLEAESGPANYENETPEVEPSRENMAADFDFTHSPTTLPSDTALRPQSAEFSHDRDSIALAPKYSQASDVSAAEALHESPALDFQGQKPATPNDSPDIAPGGESICFSQGESEGELSSWTKPLNEHMLDEVVSKELTECLISLDEKLGNELHLSGTPPQSCASGSEEAVPDEVPDREDSAGKTRNDAETATSKEEVVGVLAGAPMLAFFQNQQVGAATSMASTLYCTKTGQLASEDAKEGAPRGFFGRLCPKSMRRSRASSRVSTAKNTDSRRSLAK